MRRSAPLRIANLALAAFFAVLGACSGTPPDSESLVSPLPPPATTAPTEPLPLGPPLGSPTAGVAWHTYDNQQFGFSFEVPEAYQSAGASTQCRVRQEPQADGLIVHWGMRSTLAVFPSQGRSAEDLLRSLLSPDATQVEMTSVAAGGIPGWKATYRFGGPGRLGLLYAFEASGRAFAASYTAGPGCELAGFPMPEAAAFDHAMQSLSIEP